MYYLDKYNTTKIDKLKTEVEQRTTFSLNRCELNIFETHKKAENIKLRFDGFTVTSMLRGKKILKLDDNSTMNYVPGETFMLTSATEMVIDFPEANYSNPSQCTALVIEDDYLKKQLQYINENFSKDRDDAEEWGLDYSKLFLQNDEKIALLGNKLMKLFSSNDPMKDILVDIKLKELVLSIMRLQNYKLISDSDVFVDKRNSRFKAVVDYIRKNITSNITAKELSAIACMSKSVFYRNFINEFGLPPNKLILNEKIKYAKTLMNSDSIKIKEVCFASGFSDPNYFSRQFKKLEGITPGEYLGQVKNS
jgi:AraC-like DNA-binding protein